MFHIWHEITSLVFTQVHAFLYIVQHHGSLKLASCSNLKMIKDTNCTNLGVTFIEIMGILDTSTKLENKCIFRSHCNKDHDVDDFGDEGIKWILFCCYLIDHISWWDVTTDLFNVLGFGTYQSSFVVLVST